MSDDDQKVFENQSSLFETKQEEMTCRVEQDDVTRSLSFSFDYQFNGLSFFSVPRFGPEYVPDAFSIGLIVGPSGSGKSTLISKFGTPSDIKWENCRAICSHFQNADDARERLSAVGLNSIPSWMRPYHVLSTGEKFRADLARRISDGAVVDEFTSVVDRAVAASCSNALRRYVDMKGIKRLVLASCHYDIVEWLRPDWWFDTAVHKLNCGRFLRRTDIEIRIFPCDAKAWAMFRNHHYLSANLNHSSRCWLAVWREQPVGFSASLPFPTGTVKNGWREHRTVVIPEFQGLGIGTRLSDAVALLHVRQGLRYFSKTSHPTMGKYRDSSPLWRPTSKNHMNRLDYLITSNRHMSAPGIGKAENMHKHANRICYSHEFTGS